MEACDWQCTKEAIGKLEKALGCGVCKKLLQEPCMLGSCDHLFCRSCVDVYLGEKCPICCATAWVKDLQLKRELDSVVGLYKKLCSIIDQDGKSSGGDKEVTMVTEQIEVRDTTNSDQVVMVTEGVDRKALQTKNVSPRFEKSNMQEKQKFLSKGIGQKQKKKQTKADKQNGGRSVVQENERNKAPAIASSSSENEIINPMSVYDFVASPQRPKPAAKKRARKPNPKTAKRQRVAAANRKWLRGNFDAKASEESESGFDSERSLRHVSFSIDADQSGTLLCDSSSVEAMEISSQEECLVETVQTPSGTQESGYSTATNLDASNHKDLPASNKVDTPLTKPNRAFESQDVQQKLTPDNNKPTKFSSRLTKKITQASNIPISTPKDMEPSTTTAPKRKLPRSSKDGVESTVLSKQSEPQPLPMKSTRRTRDRSSKTAPQAPEKDTSSPPKKRRGKTQESTPLENNPPLEGADNKNEGRNGKRSLRNSNLSLKNELQTVSTTQTRRKSSTLPPSAKTTQGTTDRPRSGKKGVAPDSSEKRRSSETTTKTSPKNGGVAVKRNKRGETPLHVAVIKGDINMARQLLLEGADPNVKDNAGWTPLHEACNHGHASIVSLLLDHGSLINTPGFEHDSPLHDAVMNHRLDVVKLLLERGAALDVRNMHGLTPADYAKSEPMKKAMGTKPLVAVTTNTMATVSQKSVLARNQPVVLLGTGLKDTERKQLQACAKLLGGGRVISEFGLGVTHLVASCNRDDLCMRTMKYLNAILSGVWVVSFNWITECLKKKSRAAETKFEVKGTTTLPSSAGAEKGRKNAEQQLPSLLDGCHFYLYSTFSPPTPSKDEIIQLIKNGGGRILNRQPKPDDDIVQASTTIPYHARAGSDLAACSYYIIHDHIGSRAPPRVRTGKLCTAPVSWLMDCISQFELLDLPD
ncbi:BRCA1-associated RING domain protein 1-like [Patiria miniata]|uniref:BRCA1-associated RING domain protein 1 n=1 Tax=Patiria miniata TaxID=46514 RepID=A0A913YZW7_PATMI|nr:BRCA1-associated RING domain protein 1-like [Patiria miniata]